MSLNQNQQIFELIKKSQNILIVFKQDFSGDALASSLALFLLLQKLDKKADIACQGFALPSNYSFLPQTDKIQPQLSGIKRIVLSFNIGETKIKNFSYDVKGNKLNIYLTPETGSFEEKDLAFEADSYKYDLIITIDSEDLESLGNIYEQNKDFFFNVPLINIDHKPDNEAYGQINLIELTKTSSAEIIFDLIESCDAKLMDQEIAACLLTGMISKTKSFRSANVTPRALNIAGQLILNGADRDLIIQNLYRTKSINTLKLWGKVLARLKSDAQYKMAWSYLTQKDLLELNLLNPNMNEVIEELIASAPEAEIIILFTENKSCTAIDALIYTSKNYDSLYLAKAFNPTGSKTFAHFQIDKPDLAAASQLAIESIKKNL